MCRKQEISVDNGKHQSGQDMLKSAALADTKIAPRGFEPLNTNLQASNNKALTENKCPVLSTSLDILLQKHPDLKQIITKWPDLPEHIKAAIKALIQTDKK